MKKTVLFISFLFISTTFSAVCAQAQEFEFEMDQTLVIGEESSDSTQYLFSAIRWVRPDNDGNILVAGTSNNSIRVYNEKGQYKHSIGRRGRGPGEFHELTSVEVTDNNEIMVLDRLQYRVSFFNTDGELLRTENLSSTSAFHIFFENKNNEFFVVARNHNATDNDINLVHRLDNNNAWEQKEGGYINAFHHFFDNSDPLHLSIIKAPYLATRFGTHHIAVVSEHVYTGTIAVLNTNSLQEKRLGNPSTDFVTEYNWESRHRYRENGETGFASFSGQNGGFFYKRNGSNIGLVGNENFLLHFYGLFKGDDIIPYMKIYNSEGELLEEVELREHDVPPFISERTTMSVKPHFLDEDNNLYIGDYSYEGSYPAVRVFETNLNELLE